MKTSSETIHAQLVKLVGGNVTSYRDDLLVHDATAIENMKVPEFVHISYRSGTYIYELPQPIVDNSPVKYLFSTARPSDIYTDILSMLHTYFDRSEYFGYEHAFAHSDGKKVRIVSKNEAVRLYSEALNNVIAGLTRYGVAV